ncbi:hypothetical protein ABPG77_006173 [Micractinium sp. CCAP 211/92]
MDDQLASQLAAACSRSAVTPQTFFALRERFPGYKLIRMSFGLHNKVMLSISVDLEVDGRTHASYVPIHPTAAAAAVLQNNPVVVVRQDKRSPLWDQEDFYQREGCTAVNVVSMPFYWPPREGSLWQGAPLPVPQSQAFHPTFGAMTVAGSQPLTMPAMDRLVDLALRTGRQVGPHISMLLASLEGAGLLPGELEAQEELGSLMDAGELNGDDGMEGLFDVTDSQAAAEADALLPGLSSVAAAPADFPPLQVQQQHQQLHQQPQQQQPQQQPQQQEQPEEQEEEQQQQEEQEQQQQQQQQEQQGTPADPGPSGSAAAGAAATPPTTPEEPDTDAVPIPDWLLQGNARVRRGGPDALALELRLIGGVAAQGARAGGAAAPAAPEGAAAGNGGATGGTDAAGPPPGSTSPGPPENGSSAAAAAPHVPPPVAQPEGHCEDSPPGPPESSISEHTANVLTSSSASAAAAPPAAATSSPDDPDPSPPALPSSSDPSNESGAAAAPGGGVFALPSGGLPAALASAGTLRCPWTDISFQPAGLERAFAANYSRRQQQWDLLSLALLGALLLGAAAVQLQACWPAGVLALLCFAPHFVDPQQYYSMREWLVSAALLLLSVFLSSLRATPASPRPLAGTCPNTGGIGLGERTCTGGAGGGSPLVGFGIVWFVFHTCSLSFLLLAPLLLRMRTSRALPVQACCLALALHRLPRAYASVLGRVDTVHLLLLGMLLLLGAAGGLSLAQAIECKQRVAWLGRRVRRAAATMAAATIGTSSSSG